MSVPQLTSVPASLIQGDSVNWLINFAGYPANTGAWLSARLAFAGGAGNFTIPGTPSGASWAFVVTAATAATWVAGVYAWTFQAFDQAAFAGNRITTINQGSIIVNSDDSITPASTHASRMVTLLEAALEGRIPAGYEKFIIDGNELAKIQVVDLANLRRKYQFEVTSANNRAAIAAGMKSGRSIKVKFTSANPLPSAPYPYNKPY